MTVEKEEPKTVPEHIVALYERLEKLEKALRDHVGLHCGDEPTPDNPPERVLPYLISIDPQSSPKNLPFEVALMYARAGRRIARPTYKQGEYIDMVEGKFRIMPEDILGRAEFFVFTTRTISHTDWHVIPREA